MSDRLTSFLRELRRRRVGRVAVAYAITAWVLIQVADVVFPRLGLSESLITLLIVVASVGFPIALVLAWFFDVVPDSGSRRIPVWAGAAGALVLVLVGIGATAQIWNRLGGDDVPVRSVAVLPFGNLSEDPEQAHLVAGMQDALITELAQIASIRVVSRTSTQRYRDTAEPLDRVASELGVDAVVEGTVLRLGDRLRIQAQLIRPLPRERHLWASSYDLDVRDVLNVHAEIAGDITQAIRARVTPDEANRLADTRTVHPEAYEAYLRGMYFLQQQTPDGYTRGLRHLNDAIALDPADPNAYAALALGYSVVGHGIIPDAYDRAKAAAARALDIDSTTVAAYEALAEIALYHDWDWAAAERNFRRVLALAPNLPEANAHYAWYLEMRGRTADARQSMERARSLDPLNPLWAAWAGWIALDTDDAAALAAARSGLELDPMHPHALYVAARAAVQLGRTEEAMPFVPRLDSIPSFRWAAAHVRVLAGDEATARSIAAELEEEPSPMNAFGLALTYAQLGEVDRAMQWLEEARRGRFSWMPWIHRPNVFLPLTGDARYLEMLRQLNLPVP
ncbi:MAG TPA: tetratricopeptide repeat protein, partial [Longimicrobiales bacterium]